MQITNFLPNVPKDVLLRNASKIERLAAADIPPEQNGVPLTDDQIALRKLWREIHSRLDIASMNQLGRDGTQIRFCQALIDEPPSTSPPTRPPDSRPSIDSELAIMQQNQAFIHSLKMSMLGTLMKQIEILRTNPEFNEMFQSSNVTN